MNSPIEIRLEKLEQALAILLKQSDARIARRAERAVSLAVVRHTATLDIHKARLMEMLRVFHSAASQDRQKKIAQRFPALLIGKPSEPRTPYAVLWSVLINRASQRSVFSPVAPEEGSRVDVAARTLQAVLDDPGAKGGLLLGTLDQLSPHAKPTRFIFDPANIPGTWVEKLGLKEEPFDFSAPINHAETVNFNRPISDASGADDDAEIYQPEDADEPEKDVKLTALRNLWKS